MVGLDVTALPARPECHAAVEGLDRRAQVPLDVHSAHRQPVQLRVASLAEPDQRLLVRGAALDLDHEPPGVGGAMGRVERVGGDKEQLTLADDGVLRRPPSSMYSSVMAPRSM